MGCLKVSLRAGFEPRRGSGIIEIVAKPRTYKGYGGPDHVHGAAQNRRELPCKASTSSGAEFFALPILGDILALGTGPFAVRFFLMRGSTDSVTATALQEIEIGAEVGLHDVVVIETGVTTCWRFCWLPGLAPAL